MNNDAEIRAKVEVGDGGGFTRLGKNIKNCDNQAGFLKFKIDQVRETINKMENFNQKGFKVNATLLLEKKAQLEKMENQYAKLTNIQEVSSDSLSKGMAKGVKSIKRFGLSLFGIHSIWMMVSRASSAYMAQDSAMAQKMQATWVGLGSFLAPILERITNMVIRSVKYLNVFIKALTGVDFLAKAMTKSLNKAGQAGAKASKQLGGSLDADITNLGDTNGSLAETNWIDSFNDVELNEEVVTWLDNLGSRIMILKEAFNELNPIVQTGLTLLGIGGLLTILTGKPGLVIGIAAVGLGILGLTKIFNEDLTKSVEGLFALLGAAGLIGILVGGSKGISVAGAIAGVSFALFGLNEYINGDTTEAIEGLILLLGGAGLAGAFIGGTKGLSVGLAIGSVIAIIRGFNDLLSGDTTDQIKGFIALVTGSTGLIVALNLIRGGAKAGLLGIVTPLSIITIGFVALAAGIYAVVTNWSKMTGLERVISVLGILAIAAATAAAAVGALQSAWTLGIAAAAIAAGVATISYSISSANKRAKENIPKLAVGTNYVEQDGLAYLHKGEAVVPKKFNSQEYFNTAGNQDVVSKLDVLINTLEEKDMNAYITQKSVGNASSSYQRQQERIMGW